MTATALNKFVKKSSKSSDCEDRACLCMVLTGSTSRSVSIHSPSRKKARSRITAGEFAEKPGIVYEATYKNAELIATELQE
jgi:hypothetical protein